MNEKFDLIPQTKKTLKKKQQKKRKQTTPPSNFLTSFTSSPESLYQFSPNLAQGTFEILFDINNSLVNFDFMNTNLSLGNSRHI